MSNDIHVTSVDGAQISVSTGTVAGPLPQLQIAAGNGITIQSGGGVSTISVNIAELSVPSNLADLSDVESGSTAGQVLAYNGIGWGGLTLSVQSNLADLSDVDGTPTAGQALTWDGSQWAAANVPVGTTVNGLSGSVNLVSGDNVAITLDGQNLTIASVGGGSGVSAVNGLSGSLTLAAGNGVAIAASGGTITITALANLSGYATENYVDSSVANLVNAAPASLDTLNELAAALGDDANFAANVTTLVGQKADANHTHVKSNITDLTTSDLDMGGNKVLFANYYATQADFPDATTYHGMVAHSHADGAFYGAHAGAWVRLANYGDIPAATTVNGLSGDVTLVEGDNVNLTTSGQNITIAVPDAGITWSTPPQNSSSPGSPGDVAYDDNYFYLRTSQAWRQVALSPISTAITISQQPADASVEDGDSASFTVLATAGGETISYQWEASTDNGSTFADLPAETSNTLAVTASLAGNGTQYRVGLSAAGAADVTSSVATLTVGETFRVMSQSGDDLTLESGGYLLHDGVAPPSSVTLSVVGPSNQTAAPSALYWTQTGGDIDGEAAYDQSGYSVALSSDGSRVAIGARYNDGGGATSGHVRIYDWDGSAWTQAGGDIDGEAAYDYSGYSVALSRDGSRVAIGAINIDGGSATSGHVRIYDASGTGTYQATLSVSATVSDGSALSYQWQQSAEGGVFADVAGGTSSSLSLTGLTVSDDGSRYRVIVDSPSVEPVTSDAATLTVN